MIRKSCNVVQFVCENFMIAYVGYATVGLILSGCIREALILLGMPVLILGYVYCFLRSAEGFLRWWRLWRN